MAEDDAPSCSMAEALERQSLFVNRVVASHALALLFDLLGRGSIGHAGGFINLATGQGSEGAERGVADVGPDGAAAYLIWRPPGWQSLIGKRGEPQRLIACAKKSRPEQAQQTALVWRGCLKGICPVPQILFLRNCTIGRTSCRM
jgi:hypothetical protein